MNIDGLENEFFQRTVVNHADYRNRVVDKKQCFAYSPE